MANVELIQMDSWFDPRGVIATHDPASSSMEKKEGKEESIGHLYDCSTKGFSICVMPLTGETVMTEVPRATISPNLRCSPLSRYVSL